MKRILAILTLAVMMVTGVACGTKATAETPVEGKTPETAVTEPVKEKTLKVAGLNGGYGVEHWQAIADKFEASHPGVKVELTLEKNIEDVLRPQIQAKNVPDIMYVSVGREGMMTETLIKENAVVDLTDLLKMTVPGEKVTV